MAFSEAVSSWEDKLAALTTTLPLPVAQLVAKLSVAHSDHLRRLVEVVEASLTYAVALGCARATTTGRGHRAGAALAGPLVEVSFGKRIDALRALGRVSVDLTKLELAAELPSGARFVKLVRGASAPKRPSLNDVLRAVTEVRNAWDHGRRGPDAQLAEALSDALPEVLQAVCGQGVLLRIDAVERDSLGAWQFRATRLQGTGTSKYKLGKEQPLPVGSPLLPGLCALAEGGAIVPLDPFVRAVEDRVLVLDRWDGRGARLRDIAATSSSDERIESRSLDQLLPGWQAAAHTSVDLDPRSLPSTDSLASQVPLAAAPRPSATTAWLRPLLALAAAGLALALCATSGVAIWASTRNETSNVPTPAPPPSRRLPVETAAEWVSVPRTRVLLARHEATTAEFAACAAAGRCAWSGVNADTFAQSESAAFCPRRGDSDRKPIRCLTPAEAQRLCGFVAERDGLRGGRVPTSDEWTAATGWPVQSVPTAIRNATPAPNLCDAVALAQGVCKRPSGLPDRDVQLGLVTEQDVLPSGLVGAVGNVGELVTRLHGTAADLSAYPYAAMGCSFRSACDRDSVLVYVHEGETGAQWGVRCAAERR